MVRAQPRELRLRAMAKIIVRCFTGGYSNIWKDGEEVFRVEKQMKVAFWVGLC